MFTNETIIGYCRDHAIELTRSRAYHKNDQACVEQKNGSWCDGWSAIGG